MKNYRTRWHTNEATDKKRHNLRTEARKRILKAADPKIATTKVVGIHLIRGVDLRATLEEKALSAHSLAKWTAFVNKAGTLCHFVPREGDLHARVPLYFSTLGLSDKRLESMLWDIIEGRLS